MIRGINSRRDNIWQYWVGIEPGRGVVQHGGVVSHITYVAHTLADHLSIEGRRAVRPSFIARPRRNDQRYKQQKRQYSAVLGPGKGAERHAVSSHISHMSHTLWLITYRLWADEQSGPSFIARFSKDQKYHDDG
ncbi:hypothetical protein J6590_008851 [Homalodisca vitripennis]|nr:hypothetical protein J6590_008851 [Homalodisca vitripennis]